MGLMFFPWESPDKVDEAYTEEAAILVLSILDFSLHMDYIHPESMDPERPKRLLRLAFMGIAHNGEG